MLFIQSIAKWLAISLVVVFVLCIILLGLGFLLNENEQATRAYLSQAEQVAIELPENSLTSQNDELPDPNLAIKNIITEHITCRNDQQCQVINTGQVELGCFVAVNSIGASLLLNTLTQEINEQCLSSAPQIQPPKMVSCHVNICTLNP